MKTIIGLCMVFLSTILLTGCSSSEKEIDFTQILSGSDQVQSGTETKNEEPIEVIEEDIIELLDSASTGDLITGDVIDSLSTIKN